MPDGYRSQSRIANELQRRTLSLAGAVTNLDVRQPQPDGSERGAMHLSVLNRICSSEWSRVASNIKQCITGPSSTSIDSKSSRSPNGSLSSLQFMSVDRNRTVSFNPVTAHKSMDEFGLKRSLSENAKTLNRLRSASKSSGNLGSAMLDVLTPFQALIGIKRETPAYWISSAYVYNPMFQQIDLTIRQTGVLPNTINPRAKLILVITCCNETKSANKIVKKVVLRRSGKDTAFRSSKTNFYVSNRTDVREYSLKFQIYSHSLLRKKRIAEWEMPLTDCSLSDIKSYLTKVEFNS